eukprot:s4938_g7.t1
MVLMKAVRKRAAGAGNSAPKKRQGFPDVNQDDLDEAIDNHIRVIGVKEGMNLFEYINLQPQQAENARAIFKLHPLIKALLGVSATAEIKYRNLKQSFTVAVQRFGHEVLSKHWKVEAGMLTGRAADSVLVLLKHWRRVTKSPTSWERFGSKLDNSQLQALTSLYKKTTCKGDESNKRRVLKKEVSDVTMASDGFPAMLETTSEEEEDETCSEDESSMDLKTKAALAKSAMEASPPPVAKKDWRLKAGKETKGKEGKKAKTTKKHTKKPAASAAASKLVAKAAVKTKPHGSAGHWQDGWQDWEDQQDQQDQQWQESHRKKNCDWSDWSDDWSDWSDDDDREPTQQVTLKEREWKKKPGSHRERARLEKIQQLQGVPKSAEDKQLQRLSAIGLSRFNRLQDRLGKRRKDGGPPRYGELPNQNSQPSQPSQWPEYWRAFPEYGDASWVAQQRLQQEAWLQQHQQQQAAWAQGCQWQAPVGGYVIYPGWLFSFCS